MKITAIEIRAVNDGGNPRRGFEIYQSDALVEFVEAGYQGTQVLRDYLERNGSEFAQKMDYDIYAHITGERHVTIEQWRRMGGKR